MADADRNSVSPFSAPSPGPTPEGSPTTPDLGQLTEELRLWLEPGTEVVLLFDRFIATTAILWLVEAGPDSGIEGCVRLLGVSARPDCSCEGAPTLPR